MPEVDPHAAAARLSAAAAAVARCRGFTVHPFTGLVPTGGRREEEQGTGGGDVAMPCHRPGLVPAGQPGSAAPAGNAGFLAGRHAAGCGCRSEDLGTGPIMTLARLVITWIRADDRDGLPGSASPGNFLAQDSATYAAVSVISEAAPRPHAGGPPRRPVRHEYHRQGSSRTRGSAASDRGRPVPGTPATGRSLRTGRSSKRCPRHRRQVRQEGAARPPPGRRTRREAHA